MSQRSKVTYSRHQWKDKAKQRGDRERYQRKQLARISAERDRVTKALKEAQGRLRQLEAHMQGLVALPKVDVVWMALQLFLVVRIGFRAVSRVLSLLALALGIHTAPCPQTIINWVRRLTLVRIDAARMLRGVPLSQAPFRNGLIWMIDIRIGLGTGTILAVLAFDAPPSARSRCPLCRPCPLSRGIGGRLLDGRHDCRPAQAPHRGDGPPGRLPQRRRRCSA